VLLLSNRECLGWLQNPSNTGSVGNPIILSEWSLYIDDVRGAIGSDRQVDMVKEIRDIIDDSPLRGKVFPSNAIFTYTDVNLNLVRVYRTALIIDIIAICCIATFFLQSLPAGLLIAVACAFIVFETQALLSPILHFNMITAAVLLMAVGISVEFTAHLVVSYTMETTHLGGPSPKIIASMLLVAPPLVLGTVTTFFGNLPLHWSESTYVSLYFFNAFAILVAVGIANAFTFLPAKLMFNTLVADCLGCSPPPEERADAAAGPSFVKADSIQMTSTESRGSAADRSYA